jgi:hypothetical protein
MYQWRIFSGSEYQHGNLGLSVAGSKREKQDVKKSAEETMHVKRFRYF